MILGFLFIMTMHRGSEGTFIMTMHRGSEGTFIMTIHRGSEEAFIITIHRGLRETFIMTIHRGSEGTFIMKIHRGSEVIFIMTIHRGSEVTFLHSSIILPLPLHVFIPELVKLFMQQQQRVVEGIPEEYEENRAKWLDIWGTLNSLVSMLMCTQQANPEQIKDYKEKQK